MSPATVALSVGAAVALGAIAVAGFGLRPALLPALYLAATTPALVLTDVRQHRLPNALVGPAWLVALAAVGAEWALGTAPTMPLVAGAAVFGFLLLLALGGGMGMGDVKLGGALALAAALAGPVAAVLYPVVAFVSAGVVAVGTFVRTRESRSIAFGPFLLLGFWVSLAARFVLWGD